MAYTLYKQATFTTGLANVGYTLYNDDGSLNTARSTSGVVEIGTSGIYGATISFPDNFDGSLLWDNGSGTYASEAINSALVAQTQAGGNLYATLVQFKARAAISDTNDDTSISQVLAGVSRQIDVYCKRHFYSATETRYYTATDANTVYTDDIVSVTTLSTDDASDRAYSTTWSATDFELMPRHLELGAPYLYVMTTPNGNHYFPNLRTGVKILGVFGWSSVPDPIREACLIQSLRIWKRKDAIFGVVGSADMGQILTLPKFDPDVKLILDAYRKYV